MWLLLFIGITSFEYGLCGQGKPDFYSAVGWFIPFFDANGVSSPLRMSPFWLFIIIV